MKKYILYIASYQTEELEVCVVLLLSKHSGFENDTEWIISHAALGPFFASVSPFELKHMNGHDLLIPLRNQGRND
jgi:hypothetical protein